VNKFKMILRRNYVTLNMDKVKKNRVNLEWVDNGNVGDSLGPVICDWMLAQKGLNIDDSIQRTTHLITCGSLVGAGSFDSVVWGSGIHVFANVKSLLFKRYVRKYDVRAVRGPITRQILIGCGYDCKPLYGDPAVLMPYIYKPKVKKKYEYSAIIHYKNKDDLNLPAGCHRISPATTDYQFFIDEICASKKILSSSLHGIILAESYGVPTVFINTGGDVDDSLMKYYDWYFSTNRRNIKIASSFDEAIEMESMNLPNLSEMRADLVRSFPYDLWEK